MTESEKRNYIKRNSRRMNRLEELGRVDAEKAYTRKGRRNLKDEKKRIVGEITDPKRKEELRKKLQRPFPKLPSRKLTPEQRERIQKHLLKTGRPKIAKKGWK
tara:strand:- start:365 stop:673 length:309 start_codon:yes stop_codon:yes gene_type:complete